MTTVRVCAGGAGQSRRTGGGVGLQDVVHRDRRRACRHGGLLGCRLLRPQSGAPDDQDADQDEKPCEREQLLPLAEPRRHSGSGARAMANGEPSPRAKGLSRTLHSYIRTGSRYSGCVSAPQLLSPPTPIWCQSRRTSVNG